MNRKAKVFLNRSNQETIVYCGVSGVISEDFIDSGFNGIESKRIQSGNPILSGNTNNILSILVNNRINEYYYINLLVNTINISFYYRLNYKTHYDAGLIDLI